MTPTNSFSLPNKESSVETTTTINNGTKDPYFANKVFNRLLPLSGIYTITAHFALLLSRPFPFLFRDAKPSTYEVYPEDRFRITSPSSSTSTSTSSSSLANEEQHIAIVTGSNTGIGFETASSLVEMGYDVILACRSKDKGEQAVHKINARHGNANANTKTKSSTVAGKAFFLHPLDLSSLESVRKFAKIYISNYNHLNILVNNAGINSTGKSIDGMDTCFQTNFIGHYLLTRLLLPVLLTAKNEFKSNVGGIGKNGMECGRVVNLSSVTHHFAGASEDRAAGGGDKVQYSGMHDEEWWRGCAKPYVSDNTYKESKMASLLLTNELNRRYSEYGLRAVSANPGAVNSDIWRNFPSIILKIQNLIYLTVKQGSTTSFAAAVGDLPEGAMYLQPYWQPWGKKRNVSPEASLNKSFRNWFSLPIVPFSEILGIYIGYVVTDCRLPPPEASVAMWNVCEDLVGLKETK